jgi:Acetyltransferase (GNAT) domain
MVQLFRPTAPAVAVAPQDASAAVGSGVEAPGIRVFDGLDQLAGAYGHVLRAGVQESPFDSLEWFGCVAEYGAPSTSSVRVYVADAGTTGACFLFCSADRAGRRLSSLSNFFTLEYAPVFSPGTADRAGLLRALARFIARERPRWHVINLRTLIAADRRISQLETAFRDAGFAVHRHFQSLNRFHSVQGIDFDTYYGERPSRLRNTIRRREKKLREAHRVSLFTGREFVEERLDDYDRIYENSWKDEEIYPFFIRAMCRMAAALGILRLGILYVDERPAAAQIWLVFRRKAVIYKLAYDKALKDFSIGSILTRDMLRTLFTQEDIAEIDFGVGTEPYKRDWTDGVRRIEGMEIANLRSPLGLLFASRSAAGDVLRRCRSRFAAAVGDARARRARRHAGDNGVLPISG